MSDPTESSTSSTCTVCGQPASLRCGRCHGVWYCTKPCQKYDWKVHKTLCNTPLYPLKDPSNRTVRAIYFPERGSGDETKPQFIEVPLKKIYDEDDDIFWDNPANQPTFPEDWFVQVVEIGRCRISNRNLGYTLHLGVKEDGLLDRNCQPNRCIQRLRSIIHPTSHPWPGPLRAMKAANRGRFETVNNYQDIEACDLRYLVDFFTLYSTDQEFSEAVISQIRQSIPALSSKGKGNAQSAIAKPETVKAKTAQASSSSKQQVIPKSPSIPPTPSCTTQPIPGTTTGENTLEGTGIHAVKIYCQGDQADLQAQKFVSEFLTGPDAKAVSTSPIAPITALISFPIRVYRPQPPNSKLMDTSWSPANESATFLHLDPKTGWAPFNWQNEVGTVIVARADGKELYVEHVRSLCEFCQFHLGPLFEEWLENGEKEEVGKRKVDGEMSKSGFEAWFERYRIQQAMQVLGLHEYKRNTVPEFRWERWISPFEVSK